MRIILITLLSSCLVSINSYATDSTGLIRVAKVTTHSVAMGQESVPDETQCVDAPEAQLDNSYGKHEDKVSVCPPGYPLPHSITGKQTGNITTTTTIVKLQCCKPKIIYGRSG